MELGLDEVVKSVSYKAKNGTVEFRGLFVPQTLEAHISWAPADNSRAKKNWESKRRSGQLPPNIKMVFLVDGVGVQCVEISAKGGRGYKNVTLETFVGATNPVDIASDALELWLSQAGENSWILVPTQSGVEYGERTAVMTRREARSELLNQVRETELVELALIYAENYPKGSEALREHFGYSESTAHRKRRKAIEIGLLPKSGSQKEAYENTVAQLRKRQAEAFTGPRGADVREILRKMKEGSPNG